MYDKQEVVALCAEIDMQVSLKIRDRLPIKLTTKQINMLKKEYPKAITKLPYTDKRGHSAGIGWHLEPAYFARVRRKLATLPTIDSDNTKQLWIKQLSQLARISLQQASDIASHRISTHETQLTILQQRVTATQSNLAKKLLEKKKRENPLPIIKNKEHAEAIVFAYMKVAQKDLRNKVAMV